MARAAVCACQKTGTYLFFYSVRSDSGSFSRETTSCRIQSCLVRTDRYTAFRNNRADKKTSYSVAGNGLEGRNRVCSKNAQEIWLPECSSVALHKRISCATCRYASCDNL